MGGWIDGMNGYRRDSRDAGQNTEGEGRESERERERERVGRERERGGGSKNERGRRVGERKREKLADLRGEI